MDTTPSWDCLASVDALGRSARVWTLDESFRHTWHGWRDGSGRARASGNESAYRQPIASCFGDRRLGVGFIIARSPFRWRHRIALPFFRDDGRDRAVSRLVTFSI